MVQPRHMYATCGSDYRLTSSELKLPIDPLIGAAALRTAVFVLLAGLWLAAFIIALNERL